MRLLKKQCPVAWICILINPPCLWQWIHRQRFHSGRVLLNLFSAVQIFLLLFCGCWHLCYSNGCTEHCLCPAASVLVFGGAVLLSPVVGVGVLMHVGLNLVLGQWTQFRNVARGLHVENYSWRGPWAQWCEQKLGLLKNLQGESVYLLVCTSALGAPFWRCCKTTSAMQELSFGADLFPVMSTYFWNKISSV